MKFKMPTIKFSYVLLWQIFVVAFIFLFVVTSFISTYMFMKLKDEMIATSINVEFEVQTINTKQLEEIILGLEERRGLFKINLLEKSNVGDPSM